MIGNRKAKRILNQCLLRVIVVVTVMTTLTGCSGGNNNNNNNQPGGQTSGPQTSATTPESTSAQDTQKTITATGQSVTTDNFVVTLEALNTLKGDEFNQPAEGKEFVELILVIENVSDEEYTVSSMLMFDAYEDGYAISESLSAQIASDVPTLDGTLAAGKKIRGKLAYELSKDWKELEVDVDLTELSFSDDGKIKIKITK